MVGKATSTQTAAQVDAPLLCVGCEQRFNNQGERWVLQNCSRSPGAFKILDVLKAVKPLYPLDDGTIYAGAQIAQIDVDALVYFASCVIWKAAARTWVFPDYRDQLNLGPYYEDFRLYLLGQRSFPKNAAIWLIVWTAPVQLSVLPHTLAGDGYRHHYFTIPGITFHLFVGRCIPEGIRVACAAQSPERAILLSSQMTARMLQGFARKVLSTRATGNLRKG